MSVFTQLHSAVLSAISDLIKSGLLPETLPTQKVVVEAPRNPSHGDAATNAALVLGTLSGKGPQALATLLVEKLKTNPLIEEATSAGPGFINMRLSTQTKTHVIADILTSATWGQENLGNEEPVLLEYLSANPTGPVHIGHTRGAVLGDILGRLWKAAGWKVNREYYVNDAGGQIDTLARSVYTRYEQAHGRPVTLGEGLYPGDYLIPVGENIKDALGDQYLDKPEDIWLPKFRTLSVMAMMAIIQEDIDCLGLSFDSFFSEASLHSSGTIPLAIKSLESQELLTMGQMDDPSKGTHDGRTQTLFKSTLFGDDKDRPIQKADGSWTYFAADIAYHWDKLKREPTKMVTILGADHSGYVSRLQSSVSALSHGTSSLDVILVQMVSLVKDGKPLKMSKRAGSFVTVRDLVDAVGKDAVRFFMIWRDVNSALTFDFDTVVAQSRDNPLYYIQYASARCFSILSKAGNPSDEDLANVSWSPHPSHEALITHLNQWPETFKQAALQSAPHKIAGYLHTLAGFYHSAWHEGYDNPSLRMLSPDNPGGAPLTRAVQKVLHQGLDILGIEPAEIL